MINLSPSKAGGSRQNPKISLKVSIYELSDKSKRLTNIFHQYSKIDNKKIEDSNYREENAGDRNKLDITNNGNKNSFHQGFDEFDIEVDKKNPEFENKGKKMGKLVFS